MHTPIMSHIAFSGRIYPPLLELQLYHVFDRARRGEATLARGLTHWTMAMGLLPRQPDEPHHPLTGTRREVAAQLEGLYDRHPDVGDAALFAQQAYALLEPWLRAYLEGWAANPAAQATRWFGCFGYTVEPQPRPEPRSGLVALHFYNAACPRSPFEDGEALRDDLRECVGAIQRDVPGARGVQCGSWVNNLARLQALFPQSYVDSLVPTDPAHKNGLGWWGQFVDHTGALAVERARVLRESGRFRYQRLLGACALAEFA